MLGLTEWAALCSPLALFIAQFTGDLQIQYLREMCHKPVSMSKGTHVMLELQELHFGPGYGLKAHGTSDLST